MNNPLQMLIMSITLCLILMIHIIHHCTDKDMTLILKGDHLIAYTPAVDEEATVEEDVILILEATKDAVTDRYSQYQLNYVH